MIREQPAAKLKTVVDATVAPQARFQFKLKVRELAALPYEILVYGAWMLLGNATGDGSLVHGPIAGIRSFPSGERPAIKDGTKLILTGSCAAGGEQCD